MFIVCPKCHARHDASRLAPDVAVPCPCGRVLRSPKSLRWTAVLTIVIAAAVPFLLLPALSVVSILGCSQRSRVDEARVNLLSIRAAELSYYDAHRTLVAAGPSPEQTGGTQGSEFVPDQAFRTLEWRPKGRVNYQYAVQVTGPKTAVATARGDLDGNGQFAQFRLEIDADARTNRVQTLTPNEL